ncbi:transglutaminase family protein [Sinorhizobium sp. BG8]|uniref:transglutaminase family protein n=1 Tax=Sinorhizobium sp. BG8 TaxID=2613773 RepID=UPI00193D7F65|nr:transglutaminase family protein [Sinorhizobium sp. BG8]QRM56694.1 transglutaminase family protein [Sinorhizobium sp. BG8]
MLYDVTLRIEYVYDTPVSGGRHMVRVLPLSIGGRQRLVAGSIDVMPRPIERTNVTDFFDNPAMSILFRSVHDRLDIKMQARVHVDGQDPTPDFSPQLDGLPDDIVSYWSLDAGSPHHYVGPSPRLPHCPEIAEYASRFVTPDMTVREIAKAICAGIHKDFTYDAKATTVDTTPRESFKLKRGVCQDFTHVMIVALRSLGIPAGYVSGFLRTIPPPGKERLEGADAMHAWVRFWGGRINGWMELDPTNNIPAGTDHIVVGYGRDYSDVAPVIGILKGYGRHKTDQAVDVVPVHQFA